MNEKLLLIPGPTHVRSENLMAQIQPMIGHRGNTYSDLQRSIVENLKILLNTQNDVFISTSSASGCMEACIRNGVEQKVLCLVNGAFSERWAEIAEANGKQVDRLEVEWGEAIKPELLETQLKKTAYEAVTVVFSETSTGARNPIEKLSNVMKKYPKILFFVDGVSLVGGEAVRVDEWGIDVCLFGTQKALALPPGVAFMSVSERALEKAKTVANRGFYFDFLELKKYAEKHQTPVTPPISLLFAVQKQLQTILLEEGLENRYERHRLMAEHVRRWGENHFKIFTNPAHLVNTLTTFKIPENFNVPSFIKATKESGFEISNGYGKLKDKTFRIGHMGDHSVESMETLTSALDNILTPKPLIHETAHCQ